MSIKKYKHTVTLAGKIVFNADSIYRFNLMKQTFETAMEALKRFHDIKAPNKSSVEYEFKEEQEVK